MAFFRYALQGYSSRLCLFADAHLLALTSIALASTEFGINVTQLANPYRPNVPWYQLVGGDSPAAQRARRNGMSTESDLHVAVQLLLKYCRTAASSAARRAAIAEAVVAGSSRRMPEVMASGGMAVNRRMEFDSYQPLGISILGDRVVGVDAGRQAASVGVRVGWRLVRVNEHPFSGEILRDVIAAKKRCSIEFEIPGEELGSMFGGGLTTTDSGSTTVTTAGSGGSSSNDRFHHPGGTLMGIARGGGGGGGKRKQPGEGRQQKVAAASPTKKKRTAAGKKAAATGKGKKVNSWMQGALDGRARCVCFIGCIIS